MTKRLDVPFNVDLLELSPAKLQGLRPVRVLDIFDGATTNFHEDGLFSVLTFGKVGDERRSMRFSYIDVKVKVFHPIVHSALLSLKRLYGGIISGTEFAVWNEEIQDFERSDALVGKTGFNFFVSKWDQIRFDTSKSASREQYILMIQKYRKTNKAMTDKVVVMPAGLRDVEIDEGGRISEHEINGLYRKMLAISNTISDVAVKTNPEMINNARNQLQHTFNEIYEMIVAMIEGKKKLLQGKWASRRIQDGTRNVITAMDTSTAYLGAPGSPGFNHTIVGLYQALKAVRPIACFMLRTSVLNKIFLEPGAPVRLVNPQTLKSEEVALKPQYYDRWMTNEGVEKVLTSFKEESLRHKALMIEGRYLALVYKGPDNTFKIIHDIDEVPEARSKKDVHAITFCELLYLSCYTQINKYPIFVTRYPITGVGSIYPSKMFVRTTVRSEVRRELNENWEPMDDQHVAHEFPIANMAFVNSLVPHSSHLDQLGADFDGDTASGNAAYTDESIKEVDEFLTKKKAYVGTNGRLTYSTDVSTVKLVMHNLTGE